MGGDGTGDARDATRGTTEGSADGTSEDRAEDDRAEDEGAGPVASAEPPAEPAEAPTAEAGAAEAGARAVEPPPRSAAAAALLNLTGLGLGYLYLRCRLRATACLIVVALMVWVAFANDAAGSPWLWRILAAAWAVATALDAWFAAGASPRPAPPAAALRPVALGVVAVLAVVAGHVAYAEAARATYAAGLAAQAGGDCTAADRSFAALTGPYELTLSRDVPAAALRRAECAAFLGAQEAERAGALAGAVASYQAFRRDHPDSLLEPFAREGARRTLGAWAEALRGAGDLSGAISRYRELLAELGADPAAAAVREDLAATHVERAAAARATLAGASGQARVAALRAAMEDLLLVARELPDTAAAAGVAQAVLDTFAEANTAVAEGRFCDALPVLDYAVTLPDSAGLAGAAHGDRARSLTGCALTSFEAGDYTGAADRFGTLVAEYPDDPAVPQARSALITAEVGRAAGVPLPLPAPIDAPASEPVLVYNATSTPVRVLVAGPTAQEVTLPACAGCPVSYAAGAESCPGGGGQAVDADPAAHGHLLRPAGPGRARAGRVGERAHHRAVGRGRAVPHGHAAVSPPRSRSTSSR